MLTDRQTDHDNTMTTAHPALNKCPLGLS